MRVLKYSVASYSYRAKSYIFEGSKETGINIIVYVEEVLANEITVIVLHKANEINKII